ncbi:hypothetical protein MNBD_GAMMA22-2285 [hydrothermal vent metagenome]|uniref:Uncharacterized protein n=1 Tax=hydrothermal vent metagenome TaxID=652676 RepID=A0A3B1ABU4_9ZZZZ
MKIFIKEMNDGSAVIETQYGQHLSYFENITQAQLAYVEWYLTNDDIREDDDYYLI